MIYQRKIYNELFSHVVESPLVTVLTGMRRTGKTTLVKQVLEDCPNKNSIYMDLQRPDNRELWMVKNYESIIEIVVTRGLNKNEPMMIVLDEIQLVPDIPSAIKYLLDHFQIKFVVTGSSSFYLKNLFTESLAGRKKIFELYPLGFDEFLAFKSIKFGKRNYWEEGFDGLEFDRLSGYYEEYIKFGGFPQVVLAQSEEEKRDLLLDIMSSYVNIDIKFLADFADVRNLYNLAKLLAGRVGSRLEYTTLSRLTGLARETVKNYVSFFEKTYLISTVPVYTRNIGREIVKARKLYFGDTGLANILNDLSGGAQFENTVFNQLSRLGTLQYFALKSGQEIDFVFNEETALETKETPIVNDGSSLENLAGKAGLKKWRLVGRKKSPVFDNYIWGGSIG